MNELYNRYALALLDLAKEENKVVEYRQEVDSLLTVIKDNPEIMKFFGSYYTSEEAKNALIDEKLSKYYSKNVINFIKVILKNDIYDASLVTQVDELKSRLLRKGS